MLIQPCYSLMTMMRREAEGKDKGGEGRKGEVSGRKAKAGDELLFVL